MKTKSFIITLLIILSGFCYGQIGKVGINTTSPLAMLHVKDSSVVFTGLNPLPLPGATPVSGAGTRMMWYADKAAFRAGNVSGTQWNKDSIGLYSIAFGLDTKARGLNSTAMGGNTSAAGNYSTAMGIGTISSGNISLATGQVTIASGEASTAMGFLTKASGNYSTANGYATVSSGFASFSTGEYTTASNDLATAMGYETIANGAGSTAIGAYTRATGQASTAMGWFTIAKPYASLALGQYNDTTSVSSIDWILNDPAFMIGNGSGNNSRSNAFTVLKNGKTGINTAFPSAMLHVVKNAPSGGSFNPNSAAIVESNQDSYFQFSNTNTIESGILSGNALTSIRSGIIFKPDSSIYFRTGGNINRVVVDKIGKVGINTTTPQAMLTVKDSSVLFTGLNPLPGIPGKPPVSGAGTRMMWYPDKGAFRTGNISGTQWNKDSTGVYSIATGHNTKAKGSSSAALGDGSSATGISSTAMGDGTLASGSYSTAMGSGTMAGNIACTAMGNSTTASGSISTAMGNGTMASGDGSIAMGDGTKASGVNSTSMGFNTIAKGILSVSMGMETKAKPYASVVLGRFNDTTAISTTTWNVSDPLLILGNGTADNARSNALTVLKNGKTGINTASPQAPLHVVRNLPSGGPFNNNLFAIYESDISSYIQLSNQTADETGILSGNGTASIRSAVVFAADSSLQLRSGGNINQMVVKKNGNVGIGTVSPAAKLDVKGTVIIGVNGTALTEIIKLTAFMDVSSVAANSSLAVTFPVTNSALSSTVYISPTGALSNGLIIAYARVSVTGTVEVKFTNTSGSAIDPPAMEYYVTIIH